MALGMEVGLSRPRRLCVRRGPSFFSPKGAQFPQFSANVRCGQTTGWTKMALGMEVGLGPGRLCVRWGPSYPQNRVHTHHHPVFCPYLLWPNGWMDEDATWYGSRPRPRPHCIRWGGPSCARNGHSSPHLFGPCLLWPRSPISATAELLFYFLHGTTSLRNHDSRLADSRVVRTAVVASSLRNRMLYWFLTSRPAGQFTRAIPSRCSRSECWRWPRAPAGSA